MLVELGLSSPLPFPYTPSSFVAEVGGGYPRRREAGDPNQGFVRFLARGEGELCTSST